MADFHPLRPWRPRVAIDVGTAFIRVATSGEGIETLVGDASAQPLLRRGVVANPEAVSALLRPCLGRFKKWGMLGPRVLAGVPTDARDGERESLCRALRAAGAAEVELVPEPRAAALGAGVDLSCPYAQMIVDVGEGVTDCAILRAGRILAARALRIGCADLREQIRQGVSPRHGNGADPAAAEKILATVADFLRGVPHEPGCEIIESGILLTGGGALLPGMAQRLAEATSIPVRTPPNPIDAVILGLRAMADAS